MRRRPGARPLAGRNPPTGPVAASPAAPDRLHSGPDPAAAPSSETWLSLRHPSRPVCVSSPISSPGLRRIEEEMAIVVPAGAKHNLMNTGEKPCGCTRSTAAGIRRRHHPSHQGRGRGVDGALHRQDHRVAVRFRSLPAASRGARSSICRLAGAPLAPAPRAGRPLPPRLVRPRRAPSQSPSRTATSRRSCAAWSSPRNSAAGPASPAP